MYIDPAKICSFHGVDSWSFFQWVPMLYKNMDYDI